MHIYSPLREKKNSKLFKQREYNARICLCVEKAEGEKREDATTKRLVTTGNHCSS